ncbi:MAG: DUF6230 family protein [Bacillota bacterium]
MTGALNINRRRFILTGGIGFSALLAVLVTLLLTGTVFAAIPIAGIGGFMVTADQIVGHGFQLVPTIGDTNSGQMSKGFSMFPMAQNSFADITISGMNLSKKIDLSQFPFTYQTVELVVEPSGDVTSTDMIMNMSGMNADSFVGENMTIDENMTNIDYPTTATPDGMALIGMAADTVTISGAEIQGHYIKAGSMTIPGMKLYLKYYDASGNEITTFTPGYVDASQLH